MQTITCRKAKAKDVKAVAAQAKKLWDEHSQKELEEEFASLLCSEDCAVFLAFWEDEPVGFAQCQLRRDYVEGTHTSPVGYLEGIFVREDIRRQGVAKKLLTLGEAWAKEQGCVEFASDCSLENEQSRLFHKHAGFAEAAQIVCFQKKL